MKDLTIFLLVFLSFTFLQLRADDSDRSVPEISVERVSLKDDVVNVEVDTNIPTPIEVMISVSLKNQEPNDTYIGTTRRVILSKSKSNHEIDVSRVRIGLNAPSLLPDGEYTTEVSFYPRWGAKNNPEASRFATEEIHAASDAFMISGSNQSSCEIENKAKKQSWVMEEIHIGYRWNEELFTQKLGDFEELQVTRGNPRILKALYFPDADMTIIVNMLKDEVAVWRIGKQTE